MIEINHFTYDLDARKSCLSINVNKTQIIINKTIDYDLPIFKGKKCLGFEFSFTDINYIAVIFNEELSDKLTYIDLRDSKATNDYEIFKAKRSHGENNFMYYSYSEVYPELVLKIDEYDVLLCLNVHHQEENNFEYNPSQDYIPGSLGDLQHYFPNYKNIYLKEILFRNGGFDKEQNILSQYYFSLNRIDDEFSAPIIINAHEKKIIFNELMTDHESLFTKIHINNKIYYFYTLPTQMFIEYSNETMNSLKIDNDNLPIPQLPVLEYLETSTNNKSLLISELINRSTLFCIYKIIDNENNTDIISEIIQDENSFLSVNEITYNHNEIKLINVLPDYREFLYNYNLKVEEKNYDNNQRELLKNIDQEYNEDEWRDWDDDVKINTDNDRYINETIENSEKACESDYIENFANKDFNKKIKYPRRSFSFFDNKVPILLSDEYICFTNNLLIENKIYENHLIYKLYHSIWSYSSELKYFRFLTNDHVFRAYLIKPKEYDNIGMILHYTNNLIENFTVKKYHNIYMVIFEAPDDKIFFPYIVEGPIKETKVNKPYSSSDIVDF